MKSRNFDATIKNEAPNALGLTIPPRFSPALMR
jgi:hypothetical protein